MIDVTLLGTAALYPLPDRALAAAFLSCGGHSLLLDCGEGTQAAARKAGVSLMKVDMIALTHYHGDHTFGLPGLLQTMCSMGRTEPLYFTGPEGLEKALAPILALAGWTSYAIEFVHLPADGLCLASLMPSWPPAAKLVAFPTDHGVPSQGYCFTLDRAGKFLPQKAQALGVPVSAWGRLQQGERVQVGDQIIEPRQVMDAPRKGLKVVFSGDTTICDPLIAAANEADLLICDATYGETAQAEQVTRHGHMSFAQAATVAAKAGAKRLWLAHYSPRIEDPQTYLPLAQAIFENAVCGTDGIKTTLTYEA